MAGVFRHDMPLNIENRPFSIFVENAEEYNRVMRKLENHGCVWVDSQLPTAHPEVVSRLPKYINVKESLAIYYGIYSDYSQIDFHDIEGYILGEPEEEEEDYEFDEFGSIWDDEVLF